MSYGHADVGLITPHGRVVVHALIPRTPADRVKGLRAVRFLPWGSGMLFAFRPWQQPVLTMTGVTIPLDMLFFDAHRVLGIYAAAPGQPRIVGPQGTHWVLETPGGFADAERVAIGQPIQVALR